MLQGTVIIDFEYDEEKEECRWDLKQEGKDTLSNEDVVHLLRHCIAEFMTE
ncbi:MAG: hypothetical protein JXA75_03815 [Candidatus Thermoplasmatota archaeon]|nr:hypothetical protein [Candidatus Thermoplasmatota archaeon]